MMKNRLFAMLATALLPSLACAAEEKADGKGEEKKADVKVEIEGNDLMQFNKKEFSAVEGQVVALTLKHTGKLPKAAMGHNVVILQAGTDVTAFATGAVTAGVAADYIPTDPAMKKSILAKTKMLGGGETDTITFTAPKAGEYDYVCTFPGHFALMRGKMKVTTKE